MDSHKEEMAEVSEERELYRLRLKVWRSRNRRSRALGRVFILMGFASLVLGYFTNYLALEAIALTSIPLGTFLTFSGSEPHIKTSLASRSLLSVLTTLRQVLDISNSKGKAIYIPSSSSERDVKMYLPAIDIEFLTDSEADWSKVSEGKAGYLLTPPGHALFSTYRDEVGQIAEGDLRALLDQLQTVLVSGLRLAEKFDFVIRGERVEVSIVHDYFGEIGRDQETAREIYGRIGCPITSSVAEWVSYGMNVPVYWIHGECDAVARKAVVIMRLGEESRNP